MTASVFILLALFGVKHFIADFLMQYDYTLAFYSGGKIPGADGDAFVAQKGGWNATAKVGYCLSRILFEDGHPYGEQKVVNFLKNGTEILGRPADVAQAPDGSLVFSDDLGGKVYRLRYTGK